MSWILALPLLTPFATAVLAFLLRKSPRGGWVSLAGSLIALLFATALMVQVVGHDVISGQMGGWAAPFGITLVADRLSAIMVLLTAITGLSVSIYALGEIDPPVEEFGYHSIFQVLLGGVTGAFLTGDLFNLYVWFEVILISSFGLLILRGQAEQIDGAVKYVTLNMVATVLFLSGTGLLYGITGTLNMADLSRAVAASDRQNLISVVSIFFLLAFAMKAAVFPLFFWLPSAYHTPTFAVSAVFAALVTKVGVYALFRAFTLIFTHDTGYIADILLWAAVLTMLTGVFGALAQSDFRKVLSFQIISSIGFLILGLGLYTPLALTGAIFYLIHNIIVKANLFMIAGVVRRLTGDTGFSAIGGLYRTAPLLAFLFLIPAFSLGGFPPLSGFWAKFLLVKASLDADAYLVAAVVLATGLLTVWSMMQLWSEAFWKPHPDSREPSLEHLQRDRAPLIVPIACLSTLTLLIGLFPAPVIALSEAAAAQLLDPAGYIGAVLGGTP